jgi:16S rRNA processing protein RimM
MGRIVGPFGIRGWLKVHPFSDAPENLLTYRRWWVGSSGGWKEHHIHEAKVQAGSVVAKLEGCEDRNAAFSFRGNEVAVARDALPGPAENEFYWADLIGLSVVNVQGEAFGTVSRILETGANDVLVVDGDRERLIPFTEQVVKQVDLTGRRIRVDWGSDY